MVLLPGRHLVHEGTFQPDGDVQDGKEPEQRIQAHASVHFFDIVDRGFRHVSEFRQLPARQACLFSMDRNGPGNEVLVDIYHFHGKY